MPELSRFYGIVVQVYYGDNPPAQSEGQALILDIKGFEGRWVAIRLRAGSATA